MRGFSWLGVAVLACAASAAGAACAAPDGGSPDETASSTDDLTVVTANRWFVTQWGPTPFNAAEHPDGYGDCGPTSWIMVASSTGYSIHPSAAEAEASIRWARDLLHGRPTPQSIATWAADDLRGFQAVHANAYRIAPTRAAIDPVLRRGGGVLLTGDPRNAWGLVQDAKGQYLHHYVANPDDHFGHTVAILGLSIDGGHYVVGNPLSTVGVIKVTPEQIDRYVADYASETEAVGVDRRRPSP